MGSLGFTSQFYSWKGKPTNLKCVQKRDQGDAPLISDTLNTLANVFQTRSLKLTIKQATE